MNKIIKKIDPEKLYTYRELVELDPVFSQYSHTWFLKLAESGIIKAKIMHSLGKRRSFRFLGKDMIDYVRKIYE